MKEQPNQRMKLSWRGGRLKGNGSVLSAAAHHAAYARFVRPMRHGNGMRDQELTAQLTGGDRRSIGRANRVAALAARRPAVAHCLVQALHHRDAVVRIRAADALEKAAHREPRICQVYVRTFLRTAETTRDIEVQWHMAQLLAQAALTPGQQQRLLAVVRRYQRSRSAIVRTEALTTLTALADRDPSLRPRARRAVVRALRAGTAAERARARRLWRSCEGTA